MFTGIITAIGRITQVVPESADPDAGVRLRVDARALDRAGLGVGDSVTLNGACMTVVAIDGATLEFDVSRESLDRTAGLDAPGEVNLEKALRFGDRLDGHLVTGHVDGTGTVVRFEPVGESYELVIRAPTPLARYIALKGSIAVDGVSLTINRVDDRADGCEFSINVIPHTTAVTTLQHVRAGDAVNLEIDTIARYIGRMLDVRGATVDVPARLSNEAERTTDHAAAVLPSLLRD
jgi:riboflavin synthase